MKDKYIDLVEQTFDFPQEEFEVGDDYCLTFHDINLMDLIKQYGTPLKFTYLPKISENIDRAKKWFNVAMAKVDYKGKYNYCYCTKSSHFRFVLEEALKSQVHIETSSAFDLEIVRTFYEEGRITKDQFIVSNGYKTPGYIARLAEFINDGFTRCMPVIDNVKELEHLTSAVKGEFNVGIRIASEEEPKFEFYTSRLGIGYRRIVPFYREYIKENKQVKLRMLHFFINTGITDTAYYWNELHKCLRVYCELKRECPDLMALNIGGGFPIKRSLTFDYDYAYMAEEIIAQIKQVCTAYGVDEPDIFTEFGSFTVGESGGTIYSIIHQKQQNDREKWNMIDGSFMTTLPDAWAISQRFVMLPVNHWNRKYERVLLGGLTCDSDDYYNSEQHVNAIYLPQYKADEPLYIGFFNTGAYQESLSGYGGIQHCLIPSPKHIIIDKDDDGSLYTRIFSKEQSHKSMLKILGY
ncbi:MAG: arginine decarboxylase [Flavobacteriales bacterium]|nr:arginine decarboxylase [Bacteroidota bacterium]MCB9240288.1 arginine decarboxylase [Flavobacteriales bacterium]